MAELTKSVSTTLFDYLKDVLFAPAKAKLDVDALPEEFQELGEGLVYIAECISETRTFAKSLSDGNLNIKPPSPENEIAAPLKSLHATLKHLTWQTQQVAKGDYSQHVDFMGEFSEAFNSMVDQLSKRQVEDRNKLHTLERVAYRDALTKNFNRYYGMQILGDWLTGKKKFALCFIDIDNLKYVNDQLGHNEGDKYILCVSDVLNDFGTGVIISRLGGDEFMLLAPEHSEQQAEKRLAELREQLISHNEDPGSEYNHSLSYGIIEIQKDNQLTASELLSVADEKMYNFKKAHKAQRRT